MLDNSERPERPENLLKEIRKELPLEDELNKLDDKKEEQASPKKVKFEAEEEKIIEKPVAREKVITPRVSAEQEHLAKDLTDAVQGALSLSDSDAELDHLKDPIKLDTVHEDFVGSKQSSSEEEAEEEVEEEKSFADKIAMFDTPKEGNGIKPQLFSRENSPRQVTDVVTPDELSKQLAKISDIEDLGMSNQEQAVGHYSDSDDEKEPLKTEDIGQQLKLGVKDKLYAKFESVLSSVKESSYGVYQRANDNKYLIMGATTTVATGVALYYVNEKTEFAGKALEGLQNVVSSVANLVVEAVNSMIGR